MIYTVTLNPAIDKTVVIENLRPGKVNRVSAVRTDAGGKGVNVSKCLKALGMPSVAAMILAGDAGRQLEAMLAQMEIPTLTVWTEGQSRTNLKIIDPVKQENTDINEPGPQVSADDLEKLKSALGEKLLPGDSVVLSGSLPKDVETDLYQKWTAYFRDLGASVFLDADGEPMQKGMRAAPYMIKPNDHELAGLLGKENLTAAQMLSAGRELVNSGIREVVISLGSDGALFVSAEGAFRAEGLKVEVKSTVGAGDSMVAAMAYSKEKCLNREETIRLAVAMGAASVMQSGSQSPEKELVERLAKQVVFQRI